MRSLAKLRLTMVLLHALAAFVGHRPVRRRCDRCRYCHACHRILSLVFLSEQHARQNIQRKHTDRYQEHAGPCHLLPVRKRAQSKLEYGDR